MSNEIISLHIGGWGNQIGERFWENIYHEHDVNRSGAIAQQEASSNQDHRERINVYMQESSTNKYSPRAIFIDLEAGVIDTIQSRFGSLFTGENVITSTSGGNNNWARGFYTCGVEIADQICDAIRKEAEKCDKLQGFHVVNAIGGGTGGGLGSLLTLHLREFYPECMIACSPLLPCPKAGPPYGQIYNSILSLQYLMECSDFAWIFDEEAVWNIAFKMKLGYSYDNLVNITAKAVSSLTSSFRYPWRNSPSLLKFKDLRRMATNLVPFGRMKSLSVGHVPYGYGNTESVTTVDLVSKMSFASHCFVDSSLDGLTLSSFAIFRGLISHSDLTNVAIPKWKEENSYKFATYIEDNFDYCQIAQGVSSASISATYISNSSSILPAFRRISHQFTTIFQRKAFLHWYTSEGMEESEFEEAFSSIKDLIEEYQILETKLPEADEEINCQD